MMSNGPCSSRRLFQSGCRSMVASRPPPAIAGRGRGGSPRARGRAASGAAAALAADDVRPEVAVGPRLVALGRVAPADRRRWRPAGSGTARASATSGLRASGCTLVASMTVAARRQPLGGDEVQHLEGSLVAAWSFSSSADQAAAKVGREHLGRLEVPARERRLAGAGRSDQHHQRQLGDGELHSAEHRHLRRRPTAGSSGPTGRKRDVVAEASRTCLAPMLRTRRASIRSDGRGGGSWPAGRASNLTLYSRLGVVTTTVAVGANSNTIARTRADAADRDARSPRPAPPRRSRETPVAVGERAVQQATRSRAARASVRGRGGLRRARARDGRRRRRRSRRKRLSFRSAASSLPSPQPRSSTRGAPRFSTAQHGADPLFVEADGARSLSSRVLSFEGVGIGFLFG